MKRYCQLLLILLVASTAAGLLTACGPDNDEARPRIPQNRLKPIRAVESMTPEERKAHDLEQAQFFANGVVWADSSAEPRDPLADSASCVEQADADPGVAAANPLLRLTWIAKCMEEMGWEIDPEKAASAR